MTKVREPLTLDTALARIAGAVPEGWDGMAKEVDRSARLVRKWGDKDARETINFQQMIALDLLFQRYGGEGFPIHQAFSHSLDVAVADRFFDQFEILRRARILVKEAGEAGEAVIRYALPGATEQDRRDAKRELEEAFEAVKLLLPLLEPDLPEERERGPPAAA